MSQVLIDQYLSQLDVLKKVGGTHRESVVREAFTDLLKGWGKQHDLVGRKGSHWERIGSPLSQSLLGRCDG